MVIGVLALQGDFAAHAGALREAGADAVEIRHTRDLETIDGLIIPGGESTTILKLIEEENLTKPLVDFAGGGRPIFGTCAGAILLARTVYNPAQASLSLIDIAIERNAYGRQVDSFIGEAESNLGGGALECVFIRAPRIKRVGAGVEVLARLNAEPVMTREGLVLAATFHPELSRDRRVHKLFLEMVHLRKNN